MATKKSQLTARRSAGVKKRVVVRGRRGQFKDVQLQGRRYGRRENLLGQAEAKAAVGRAAEAVDHAMRASKAQAETAFRAAVEAVEEIIRVGKRELETVGAAAREALTRLVTSARRATESAGDEAGVVVSKRTRAPRGTNKAARKVRTSSVQRGATAKKSRRS